MRGEKVSRQINNFTKTFGTPGYLSRLRQEVLGSVWLGCGCLSLSRFGFGSNSLGVDPQSNLGP
jgi:hypothetical protein